MPGKDSKGLSRGFKGGGSPLGAAKAAPKEWLLPNTLGTARLQARLIACNSRQFDEGASLEQVSRWR
jgi:hypothetical protein